MHANKTREGTATVRSTHANQQNCKRNFSLRPTMSAPAIHSIISSQLASTTQSSVGSLPSSCSHHSSRAPSQEATQGTSNANSPAGSAGNRRAIHGKNLDSSGVLPPVGVQWHQKNRTIGAHGIKSPFKDKSPNQKLAKAILQPGSFFGMPEGVMQMQAPAQRDDLNAAYSLIFTGYDSAPRAPLHWRDKIRLEGDMVAQQNTFAKEMIEDFSGDHAGATEIHQVAEAFADLHEKLCEFVGRLCSCFRYQNHRVNEVMCISA